MSNLNRASESAAEPRTPRTLGASRHFLSLLAIVLPCPGLAQADAALTGATFGSGGVPSGYVANLGIGLVIVMATFFAFSWILRRMNALRTGHTGLIRMVGGMSVGNRERLMIVEVGGKQLLLGLCPGNIQMLHVLDADIVEQPPASETTFAERFRASLGNVIP